MIKFELDDLKTSAKTYEKQLLYFPVIALEKTIQHMNPKGGIHGEKTFSSFENDLELGPYNSKRKKDKEPTFKARTIKTYLGSVIQDFDPNDAVESIWGSKILLGEELKKEELAKQVLTRASVNIGKNLNRAIWGAKRKDNGTKSVDLFNGFDTITANEIAKNALSVANKNLFEFTDAITSVSAVDLLKQYYKSSDENLQEMPTKMFIPKAIYDAYVEDYKSTGSGLPYNTSYDKVYLEGSFDLCELVPLSNKSGSDFIHLTPKANMLVGFGQTGHIKEQITIDRFSSFELTLAAAMFFGVEFHTIQKEFLNVGKLKKAEIGG